MSEFVLHPEAYNDLDEICDYISVDSFEAADRVREAIYHAIRDLVPLPSTGHRRPDITARLLALPNRPRIRSRLRSGRKSPY